MNGISYTGSYYSCHYYDSLVDDDLSWNKFHLSICISPIYTRESPLITKFWCKKGIQRRQRKSQFAGVQTQCGPSKIRAQDAAIKKGENTNQTINSIMWMKSVTCVKKAPHLEKHLGGLKITSTGHNRVQNNKVVTSAILSFLFVNLNKTANVWKSPHITTGELPKQ